MADLDVEKVLAQMTVAEKCDIVAGGDFSHTLAVKRLDIPALRMSDGPNTVRGTRFFNSTPTVCLPTGPALAATWDVQLMEELGQLLGDECIAKGAHVMLGPCINIPRTPLGGRNQEALSEDPMLSGVLAGYICRGLESKGIVATLKHFVCSDQEQGCFSMNCIVTQRALREMYLWPFMRALAIGKPGAVMAAYNKINDQHVTEDARLLSDVLRDEWSFQGLVMSDWHGLYATSIPLCAGLDLEMPGPAKWRGSKLQHALLANRLPMRHLDRAVRAVLRTIKSAARSGIPPGAEEQTLDRPQDRILLRRAAAQSVVLLRSDERTLPLDCKRPLAVIGPNARFSAYRGGRIAHLRPYYTVSPWQALQEKSQAMLRFEQGVYNHKERPLLGHQLRTASGRLGFDMYIYTEPPDVPGRQLVDHREFLNSCGYFFNYEHPDRIDGENWYVDIEGDLTALQDGPYDFGVSVQGTASLYVDGELVIDNTHNQRFGDGFFRAGTVEEVGTLDLRKDQTYHVRVTWAGAHTSELIKNSPLTFHPGGIRLGGCERLDVDASIQAAVELARTSEQVVVFAGLMGDWENEGSDRDNMDLPPRTDELISAVLDANPNAVICISAGSPVCMPWASKANNLMFVWYGGNETGSAIAEVLYGDTVPSGKLPISLPIALKDNPAYLYTRAERKRILYGDDVYVGYRYYDALDKEVLFPFGHGLSYTRFALSDLQVSMTSQDEHGTINISCKVTNTGKYEGAEVVQVYIQPHAPSVNRPPKELKAFQRATIPIGQAREVQLPPLPLKYAVTFWDEAEERWLCEKGEYTVLVGTSSRGHFLEAPLLLQDSFWWSGL